MSDWNVDDAGVAARAAADARSEIDALRQQLAEAKEENERVRQANLHTMDVFEDMKAAKERAEARAEACKQQAQVWKLEARTQAATVMAIYQELTGRTGEPGDWNGARPLAPLVLRKQAEAVEQIVDADPDGRSEDGAALISVNEIWDYAQSLRQQADEAERAGGSDA